MEGQRGDEVDDTVRNLGGDSDEVGVAERRGVGQTVESAGQRLDLTSVTHGVERPAVDASPKGFGHPQDVAVLSESLFRLLNIGYTAFAGFDLHVRINSSI